MTTLTTHFFVILVALQAATTDGGIIRSDRISLEVGPASFLEGVPVYVNPNPSVASLLEDESDQTDVAASDTSKNAASENDEAVGAGAAGHRRTILDVMQEHGSLDYQNNMLDALQTQAISDVAKDGLSADNLVLNVNDEEALQGSSADDLALSVADSSVLQGSSDPGNILPFGYGRRRAGSPMQDAVLGPKGDVDSSSVTNPAAKSAAQPAAQPAQPAPLQAPPAPAPAQAPANFAGQPAAISPLLTVPKGSKLMAVIVNIEVSVDYKQLVANAIILENFKKASKKAILSVLPPGISETNVKLALGQSDSKVSQLSGVLLEAGILLQNGISADSIEAILSAGIDTGYSPLAVALVKELKTIDQIQLVMLNSELTALVTNTAQRAFDMPLNAPEVQPCSKLSASISTTLQASAAPAPCGQAPTTAKPSTTVTPATTLPAARALPVVPCLKTIAPSTTSAAPSTSPCTSIAASSTTAPMAAAAVAPAPCPQLAAAASSTTVQTSTSIAPSTTSAAPSTSSSTSIAPSTTTAHRAAAAVAPAPCPQLAAAANGTTNQTSITGASITTTPQGQTAAAITGASITTTPQGQTAAATTSTVMTSTSTTVTKTETTMPCAGTSTQTLTTTITTTQTETTTTESTTAPPSWDQFVSPEPISGPLSASDSSGRHIWIVKVPDSWTDQQVVDLAHAFPTRDLYTGHPSAGGLPMLMVSATQGELAEAFRKVPGAEYVEEDTDLNAIPEKKVDAECNPTEVPWGLDRIDSPNGLDSSYSAKGPDGGRNVHVYVMDTGIKTTHGQFGGRAIPTLEVKNDLGLKLCMPTDPDCAVDYHGHGTHAAAVIGGTSVGVAQGAWLHAVKVLGDKGRGKLSSFIIGMDWILANSEKPAVIQAGLNGSAIVTESRAIKDVIEKATARGIPVVTGAGNAKKDACQSSPSYVPVAITVGATDDHDKRAEFSNYGDCLDLFAPGINIKTAGHTSDDSYVMVTGTSMAAAHAVGAAALVMGTWSSLTGAQVAEQLVNGAFQGVVQDSGRFSPTKLLSVSSVLSLQPVMIGPSNFKDKDASLTKGKAKCVDVHFDVLCARNSGDPGQRLGSDDLRDTFNVTVEGRQVCAKRMDDVEDDFLPAQGLVGANSEHKGWNINLVVMCNLKPVLAPVDKWLFMRQGDKNLKQACAGASSLDRKSLYYSEYVNVTEQMDCELLCQATFGCTGYNYNSEHICEVWLHPMLSYAPLPGLPSGNNFSRCMKTIGRGMAGNGTIRSAQHPGLCLEALDGAKGAKTAGKVVLRTCSDKKNSQKFTWAGIGNFELGPPTNSGSKTCLSMKVELKNVTKADTKAPTPCLNVAKAAGVTRIQRVLKQLPSALASKPSSALPSALAGKPSSVIPFTLMQSSDSDATDGSGAAEDSAATDSSSAGSPAPCPKDAANQAKQPQKAAPPPPGPQKAAPAPAGSPRAAPAPPAPQKAAPAPPGPQKAAPAPPGPQKAAPAPPGPQKAAPAPPGPGPKPGAAPGPCPKPAAAPAPPAPQKAAPASPGPGPKPGAHELHRQPKGPLAKEHDRVPRTAIAPSNATLAPVFELLNVPYLAADSCKSEPSGEMMFSFQGSGPIKVGLAQDLCVSAEGPDSVVLEKCEEAKPSQQWFY